MTEVVGETNSGFLELRQALIRCCELAGWTPQHLGRAGQPAGLEEALLEIIACRDAEATLLSMELIERCEAMGWQSPWLEDNRARLLLLRGEEAEALRIWHELRASQDQACSAIAEDTLQALQHVRRHLELRQALIRCCELAGWTPQHLGRAGQPAGLEEALLEIIACRDAEATLLSMELIERCEAMGWQSPWLEDNRARLLLLRGEEAEALRIWHELRASQDQACSAIAEDTLQALQHVRRHLELRQALIRCCELAGWTPQHLGRAGQPAGLEEALLEIIACRDAEATLLSMELIERCEAMGWQSPWLEDNRARLLLLRGEEAEALRIWHELRASQDQACSAIAEDTLQTLSQRPAQAVRSDRIRQLRERDQPEQWRPLLLEGILNSNGGHDDPVQGLLQEIALDLQPPANSPWDPDLLEQELKLQLFEEQLERWEQC